MTLIAHRLPDKQNHGTLGWCHRLPVLTTKSAKTNRSAQVHQASAPEQRSLSQPAERRLSALPAKPKKSFPKKIILSEIILSKNTPFLPHSPALGRSGETATKN